MTRILLAVALTAILSGCSHAITNDVLCAEVGCSDASLTTAVICVESGCINQSRLSTSRRR